MIFCSNCFHDSELKSIIEKNNRIGTCPICGNPNTFLYDTDSDDSLLGIFDNLLSVYTPLENLPEDFPKGDVALLCDVLRADWDIFADIGVDSISEILKALSPSIAENVPALFSSSVGILEKYDADYLNEHSILKAQSWSDFVEALKHKNRFHTNQINTELLKAYCLQIEKVIPTGSHRYYRGRIAQDVHGYSISEMGAPPKWAATDGRANSAGISRLYLTYDRETTLHEIRAAEYDYVTIGTFKQESPIRVVDLSRIAEISPFSPEVDCTSLAINREHLLKINQEMSKTMRRGDSPLDYLPTQYISDFIMSITDNKGQPIFDGVEYQSAMRKTGANLAIFYPEKFKCTFRRTYEVTQLVYHKKVQETSS